MEDFEEKWINRNDHQKGFSEKEIDNFLFKLEKNIDLHIRGRGKFIQTAITLAQEIIDASQNTVYQLSELGSIESPGKLETTLLIVLSYEKLLKSHYGFRKHHKGERKNENKEQQKVNPPPQKSTNDDKSTTSLIKSTGQNPIPRIHNDEDPNRSQSSQKEQMKNYYKNEQFQPKQDYQQYNYRNDGKYEGRNDGGNDGRNEGRTEGKNSRRYDGRIDGRNEARNDGRNEGRNEGRIEGRKEGRNEGRNDGRNDVRNDVRNDGRKELGNYDSGKQYRAKERAEFVPKGGPQQAYNNSDYHTKQPENSYRPPSGNQNYVDDLNDLRRKKSNDNDDRDDSSRPTNNRKNDFRKQSYEEPGRQTNQNFRQGYRTYNNNFKNTHYSEQ